MAFRVTHLRDLYAKELTNTPTIAIKLNINHNKELIRNETFILNHIYSLLENMGGHTCQIVFIKTDL